ncbi:MAG: hypothetical protein LUC34_05335 [Campylobacter sp.]|nr:hypothetical protein [Campylobacter sp.]
MKNIFSILVAVIVVTIFSGCVLKRDDVTGEYYTDTTAGEAGANTRQIVDSLFKTTKDTKNTYDNAKNTTSTIKSIFK